MTRTVSIFALAFIACGTAVAAPLVIVPQWQWDGAAQDPAYPHPLATPLVAQLTDDNGDGRVDALDTPDVVFTHANGSSRFARLTMVDGATGLPEMTTT